MIEVKNVVKTFDGFAALNDATLSVPTGAVYGLVGPNGAGKSTIIRHLTGIFRQDSGTVRLGGEDVWENAALKARIAAIPDDWYYFSTATIRDMMRFYKGFYPQFSTERYEKLREVFELDEKRPIRRFSKGMQKQAAFWLALSAMPDYLILDEPVDGLDPVMRSFVKKLICEDVLERGASAIITSHSLRELEDICDQLALLHKGGLVLESDIENLKTSQFKIQIAFREDYDKSKFDGIQISHYEKSGSVANLIVSGEREDIVQKLRAMDPILLDVLPLSLEEVFTYEMETLGYTFQIDDLIEEENRHAES